MDLLNARQMRREKASGWNETAGTKERMGEGFQSWSHGGDLASSLQSGVGVNRNVSLREMQETKCLSPLVLSKDICQLSVFKCLYVSRRLDMQKQLMELKETHTHAHTPETWRLFPLWHDLWLDWRLLTSKLIVHYLCVTSLTAAAGHHQQLLVVLLGQQLSHFSELYESASTCKCVCLAN